MFPSDAMHLRPFTMHVWTQFRGTEGCWRRSLGPETRTAYFDVSGPDTDTDTEPVSDTDTESAAWYTSDDELALVRVRGRNIN